VADLRCPVVIGRGAETDVLRTALGAAEGGLGSAVFLVGEAGIGKSRLAAELAAEARARGGVVLAGRSVPAGGASPYRPLTEALLQGLRSAPYPAGDALAPWRAALRAIIPALDGAEDQDEGKVPGGDYSPAVRGRPYCTCCGGWPVRAAACCSCWKTCTGRIRTRWLFWST
jgi:AAA ATPase domain